MKKNISLTPEQEQLLKIKDNRVDFYFKVENAVIDNYQIFDSIYEAHLYIILCRLCNNNQIAFPSYQKLADYCFCSKRTIINTMNSLVKKGLINKVNRLNNEKNINETNLYTVNNIKKYIEIEKSSDVHQRFTQEVVQEVHYPSEYNTPGVVQEIHYPSASDAPNKELLKKNYISKKTTTNKEPTTNRKNQKEKTNSSSYVFLNFEKYNLLNDITKFNIQKNIDNLTEEEFQKIYNLTSEYINSGKGNNFNAILYKGLLGEWNFECLNSETNKKEVTKKELDNEKKKWLSYFAGVVTDKSLRTDIECIIIDIPLDVLAKNKRKLAMMSTFEFKQHLLLLKRSC